MAKEKTKKKEIIEKEPAPLAEDKPVEKEVKKESEKKEPEIRYPVVSFKRWFHARSKVRKYKSHWIKGMEAFTDTSGNRTMLEWDEIFKKY